VDARRAVSHGREVVAKLAGRACCAADRGRAPAEWESRWGSFRRGVLRPGTPWFVPLCTRRSAHHRNSPRGWGDAVCALPLSRSCLSLGGKRISSTT